MRPADLSACRRLARIPADQQPGDWAALASAFNQLDDYLSMGGPWPPEWERADHKPYALREAPASDEQLPIPGLVFGERETRSA